MLSQASNVYAAEDLILVPFLNRLKLKSVRWFIFFRLLTRKPSNYCFSARRKVARNFQKSHTFSTTLLKLLLPFYTGPIKDSEYLHDGFLVHIDEEPLEVDSMSFISNLHAATSPRLSSTTPSGFEGAERTMSRLGSADRLGRQPSMDYGGSSRYERKFSSRVFLDNVSMESRKPVSLSTSILFNYHQNSNIIPPFSNVLYSVDFYFLSLKKV